MFNNFKKIIVCAFLCLIFTGSNGNEIKQLHVDEKPFPTVEQIEQSNYLKNVIQKEIWKIILTDTFELQKEELKNNIIFKEDKKYNISKYQEWVTEICVEEKTSSCPEIFFTRKTNIVAASMYPNGKLYLNIDMLNRLTDDEIYFIIAHEVGHFVLKHSFKKTEHMAASIVDNTFMVADIEKLVSASFMIPGMREHHHKSESEADKFAVIQIRKKNIQLACLDMFSKMTGEEIVSTQQHASVQERCTAIGI